MKRVNLAFLPHTLDNILAQVLQEPRFNYIHYAAPSGRNLHLSLQRFGWPERVHSVKEAFPDITNYLTKPHQYFLFVKSQIGQTSCTEMWTITTSIGNNKMKHVTLITTPNRFVVRTTSKLSVNKWYRYNNKRLTNNSDQQNLINNTL